jgi:hypothetical protein
MGVTSWGMLPKYGKLLLNTSSLPLLILLILVHMLMKKMKVNTGR